MGSVNVNRSVSDAFYRYKMPRLIAKVEGKGNGIKTVIVNMAEIAKALGRPATYPTKYFGCELGAQTQFDFKNDRFIVNGSHEAAKLQDLLDGFIRRFVLCPECDNPETNLLVNCKKMTINQGCKACGFHGPLEANHKLNTYILKNPPNMNPGAQGASLTEKKKGKRAAKKMNGDGDENGDHRSGSPSEDLDHSTATSNDKEDGDDGAEWVVDVSEEAVRARLQDLTEGAKTLTLSDDLDKSEKERMDIFYSEVKKRLTAKTLQTPQQAKDLLALAERLDVKSKAPLILAELLFNKNIRAEIRKHRALLLRFTHEDAKAQKYLIGGVEKIIALHTAVLMPQVPAILKVLYDSDIIEESVLLEWGAKVSKKYVSKELSQEIHNKAEPFITWLKEAEEEEDSSSEEDDDDIQIEYNDRVVKTSPVKEEKPKPASVHVDDDGDDVDIDAI